jgi:hypothetical protein
MREAHDLQHAAEADLHGKGLSRNSVGVLGSVVLGISSVAPAYALTATVGILATQAGSKMAVVIIAGFLPMFFAAYAYREFNKVAPDCGTSFTWTTKAFGPYVGWIGGWVAILATAIVLSNLAGVAVEFFYQFLGDLSGSALIGGLWENKWINVATCLTFLAVATGVAYRGITTTERIQFVLVGFQLAILLIFAGLAIAKSRTAPTGLSFSWDWFSPAGLTLSAFIAGLSGSIFAFWGWDTCLTVNEESKGSAKTPGRAALLTVISILLTYLIVATATQMYAGVGDQGVGLGNEDNASNVFGELAEPVLGSPWHLLLYLAVLASSIASLITTFLPGFSAVGKSLVFVALYGAGVAAGMIASALLRRTVTRGRALPLAIEMPVYRAPEARAVGRAGWNAAVRFLKDVGTTIVAASALLWVLLQVPMPGSDAGAGAAPMERSVAASVGRAMEPVTRLAGFDWRINVGLIGSFGARELMVGTLGVIHGLEDVGDDTATLSQHLRAARGRDGRLAYGVPTALALMAFFVLACQCMSTVAAIRRETKSWRWALFTLGYTYAAGGIVAALVFQVARALGL